jgi:hypothetical protein
MNYIKLFENFEVVEPIRFGDPLNNKELTLLERYDIPCPEFILKDDNYYYVHDHRCEKIKDLPLTYIHGVCSKYKITNYKINDDFTVNVYYDVNLANRFLTKIPLRFNMVSRSFDIGMNSLTSLKGSPKEVVEEFACDQNRLSTLEFSPKTVGDNFYCENNKLTSLKGGPDYIGGDLECQNNPLTSLTYEGKIKGEIKYNLEE